MSRKKKKAADMIWVVCIEMERQKTKRSKYQVKDQEINAEAKWSEN